jgi:hypothetical protein
MFFWQGVALKKNITMENIGEPTAIALRPFSEMQRYFWLIFR